MKLVSILSLACVLAAAGCSSTSDTGTDGGTGGDGAIDTNVGGDTGGGTDTGTGSETTGETGGDCSSCIKANCQSENDACAADSTCKTAVDCIGACSVDAGPDASKSECENACINNAGGNAALTDFITCVTSKCPTQCSF